MPEGSLGLEKSRREIRDLSRAAPEAASMGSFYQRVWSGPSSSQGNILG